MKNCERAMPKMGENSVFNRFGERFEGDEQATHEKHDTKMTPFSPCLMTFEGEENSKNEFGHENEIEHVEFVGKGGAETTRRRQRKFEKSGTRKTTHNERLEILQIGNVFEFRNETHTGDFIFVG